MGVRWLMRMGVGPESSRGNTGAEDVPWNYSNGLNQVKLTARGVVVEFLG